METSGEGIGLWAVPVDVITWRMHIQARFAALLVAGVKTVEVRADRVGRRDLTEGHLILFDTDDPAHPSLLVFVDGVSRSPSLAHLLDHNDPEAIAGPGATRDDVTALLAEIYPEPPTGYLAIEVSVLQPASDPLPDAVGANK